MNFDDLVERPDEELRILIRGLTTDPLAMALKTAPKEVVVKFYMNMSRGVEGLIEDTMGKLGSPTADDIAKARKGIVDYYLTLRAGGKFEGQ